jgi:hypothetical protein
MQKTSSLLALWLLTACGGAATQGAAPARPEQPAPAVAGTVPAAEPGKAEAPPAAVPAPPAECGAFAARAAPRAASCDNMTAARKELDSALAEQDAARRDALLSGLDQCAALPIGFARALRAELAPQVCADAIADPLLAAPPSGLRLDLRQTLEGLSLAGKLARLVENPPALAQPVDKARFQQYFRETLGPWIVAQASAIHQLAKNGVRLGGYAKGIVAVEAGTADLRFVEVVREIPLPEDMAKDEEVKNVYYASLDQALDLRKNRGRDAALVGMREFAAEGILHDARVDRARQLLSKLYAGRRIDALDGLLLPPLLEPDLGTVERRLASKLPTFYASLVLADQPAQDPALLRALLERGLPRSLRAGLDAGKVSGPVGELYARALVDLGRRYWRSEDFERAARVLEKDPKAAGKPDDKTRLVRGLANALRGGPRDAAEMMLRGPFLPAGVGNVSELDALAKAPGPMNGMAAYDAAYILQLAPPRGADAGFWKDVAARFRRAAQLLADAKAKSAAAERAKAADDTAKALR